MSDPVVLSMGMGLDSAAILMRWIFEPHTRDFPLENLICVTAMTGDEYASTEAMMNRHALPAMRRAGIRYVQIARHEQESAGRYDVLDDSRSPTKMIMSGSWRLSDEMRTAGTVPTFVKNKRTCSYRAKGQVLDWWMEDHLGDRPFRHVLGFSAEETSRMVRDSTYIRLSRNPDYPLADWSWTREDAGGYLHELVGEAWPRSCCLYCPFQAGKAGLPDMLRRWRAEPQAAAAALLLEHRALALNGNMTLFSSNAAVTIAAEHGLRTVLDAFTDLQHDTDWVLYDVRRVHHGKRADPAAKGPVWRSVAQVDHGRRPAMRRALARCAATHRAEVTVDDYGIARAVLMKPTGVFPSPSRMLAVGPAGAIDKQRDAFEKWWTRLNDSPSPAAAAA